MRKNIHRRREEPEDEGWLITFADMSVLLMCFFVLLFAISSPNLEQFKVMAEALRVKGFYSAAVPTEDPYEKLKKELSLSLGASGFDQFIAATATPKAIEVELASGAFFVPSSAKFTPEALAMLDLITSKMIPLAKSDITMTVEGHTDDAPVASATYPSNWELSAARAANVVRFFVDKGFPAKKMRVVGLADTHPKAPNRDALGKPLPANQNINRRVVIKLSNGEE